MCSVCGEVFYHNPLPAAAALVLDGERRVLLVKRGIDTEGSNPAINTGYSQVRKIVRLLRENKLMK